MPSSPTRSPDSSASEGKKLVETVKPIKVEEPEKPTEPEKPAEPKAEPKAEPEKPAGPEKPAEPEKPADTTSPPDSGSPQQEKKVGRPRTKPRRKEKNDLIVQHDYHDYANVDAFDFVAGHVASKPGNRRGQRNGTCFPMQLHRMLQETAKEGLSGVVSWSRHGRAFIVHRPVDFTRDILPRFFKQHKYTSFQRQLNLYGFLRLSRGADNGGYYHELFLRGKPDLALAMKRVKVKGTFKKPKRNPAGEPDFAHMEPVGLSESLPAPSLWAATRSSFSSQSGMCPPASAMSKLSSSNTHPHERSENGHDGKIQGQRAEIDVAEINDLIKQRKDHPFSALPLRKRKKLAASEVADKASNGLPQVKESLLAKLFGNPESGCALPPNNVEHADAQKVSAASTPRPSSSAAYGGGELQVQAGGAKSDSTRNVRKHWKKRPLVFTPNFNDVLCGRGGWINSHPGNCRYREVVKQHRKEYCLAASKSEKARISREVVDFIHGLNPRGRFLRRVDGVVHSEGIPGTESTIWVELDDIDARYKTSQALREGAPDIRLIGDRIRRLIASDNTPPVVRRGNSTVEGARQLVMLSSAPAVPNVTKDPPQLSECVESQEKDATANDETEQQHNAPSAQIQVEAPPETCSNKRKATGEGSHKQTSGREEAGGAPSRPSPPGSSQECRSHGSFSSFIDPLKEAREKRVQDWLVNAVPYLSWDDVREYSKRLIENGFDSVQILEDHLLEEDLDFMKTAHRRALVAAKISRRVTKMV